MALNTLKLLSSRSEVRVPFLESGFWDFLTSRHGRSDTGQYLGLDFMELAASSFSL